MPRKSKLRRLTIDDAIYLYTLKEEYFCTPELEQVWKTTLRILCEGHQNAPLIVSFFTEEGIWPGNPITTDSDGAVNLYRPHFVRVVVEFGLQAGWQPKLASMELTDDPGLRARLRQSLKPIERPELAQDRDA